MGSPWIDAAANTTNELLFANRYFHPTTSEYLWKTLLNEKLIAICKQLQLMLSLSRNAEPRTILFAKPELSYNADFARRAIRHGRVLVGRPAVALVTENSQKVWRYLELWGNYELHGDDGARSNLSPFLDRKKLLRQKVTLGRLAVQEHGNAIPTEDNLLKVQRRCHASIFLLVLRVNEEFPENIVVRKNQLHRSNQEVIVKRIGSNR